MALKTNFTDDILAESMNGKRQYNITENSNGTKSLEDVTDYQSVGSTFSAKNMNETNAAVNQAYDDIGDEFNPEVDYAVGDYTIRNNKIWKFTTAHPAGAWDESHVKATKILSEARELTENKTYTTTFNNDVSGSLYVYRLGKIMFVYCNILKQSPLQSGETLFSINNCPTLIGSEWQVLTSADAATSKGTIAMLNTDGSCSGWSSFPVNQRVCGLLCSIVA